MHKIKQKKNTLLQKRQKILKTKKKPLKKLNKNFTGSDQQQLLIRLNMNSSLNRSGSNHCQSAGNNNGLQLEENCYICPQCFRSYRRHGTLRRHLRQECGKGKSMVCSVCGHRTKRADHLRQHVRKRHPELGMRILYNNSATAAAADQNNSNSTPSTSVASQLQLNDQHYQQFEEQLRHFKSQHDIL